MSCIDTVLLAQSLHWIRVFTALSELPLSSNFRELDHPMHWNYQLAQTSIDAIFRGMLPR